MTSVALALGGGGARGLAHIVVLEELDALGVTPVALAGTSIGALIGACYAAGMSGKEIRRYVLDLAHDRGGVIRRLLTARASSFADLFAGGIGNMTLVDAERFCRQFLPEAVPASFEALRIPLTVVASDLYARAELAMTSGPLASALAASIALPGLTRPVVRDNRVLVDGGATNPLPFDHLRGKADVIIACDVSGAPTPDRTDLPTTIESLYATVIVMNSTITAAKLREAPPDVLITPNVGIFRVLDFFQASAILRAAEPVRTQLRARLRAALTGADNATRAAPS
jgi:NTE family protein